MQRPSLHLRLASPEDLKFVRDSWFESYRKGGFAPQVDFPTYQREQNELIDRCLKYSVPTIAFTPSAPDEICGWVQGFAGVINYVYVKRAYRRLGIASQLCEDAAYFTHETRAGRGFFAKLGAKYNPYLLAKFA